MVKCWNCGHLMIAYSGEPKCERLFAKELRKCKVNRSVFERRRDITEEIECKDYLESKHKFKWEEVEAIRKEMYYIG